MIEERRSYSRKTLNPLPYINLSPDNGGIVLDVSEEGLRVRATAALPPAGPIHFSFSAHSDLVQGIADLIWSDPVNKTGGLRFRELSDGARQAIRNWPHESDLQLNVGQDFMLHMPPTDGPSRAGPKGRGVFDAASRFQNHFSGRKPNLQAALSIAVVVILLSTLSYMRHREVGDWLVWLGTKMAGQDHAQTVAQAPAPVPSMPPSGAAEISAEQSKAEVTPEQAPPQHTNPAAPAILKGDASRMSAPQVPAANARFSTPAVSAGDLVVQVAALTQEAEARDLADNLRHKNFQAFVRTLPPDPLYRVLLGPYANAAAARIEVDKLKKAGFNSFVRREPVAVLSGSLQTPAP